VPWPFTAERSKPSSQFASRGYDLLVAVAEKTYGELSRIGPEVSVNDLRLAIHCYG